MSRCSRPTLGTRRRPRSARTAGSYSARQLASITADLVRRASATSPPSMTRVGATMFWPPQTRRASQRQRQHEDGGDAQRQGYASNGARAGVGRHSWRVRRNTRLERRCCLPGAPVRPRPVNLRQIPAWLRSFGRAPSAVRSCRMPRLACARTAACPPGDWRGRRRPRRH